MSKLEIKRAMLKGMCSEYFRLTPGNNDLNKQKQKTRGE